MSIAPHFSTDQYRLTAYTVDRGRLASTLIIEEMLIAENPHVLWPMSSASPTTNWGLSYGKRTTTVLGTLGTTVDSLIGMPHDIPTFSGTQAVSVPAAGLSGADAEDYGLAWCGWVTSTPGTISTPQVLAAMTSSTTEVEWMVVLETDRTISLYRGSTKEAQTALSINPGEPIFVVAAFENEPTVYARIWLNSLLAAEEEAELPTGTTAPIYSVGSAVYDGAVRTVHTSYGAFSGQIECAALFRRALAVEWQAKIATVGRQKTFYAIEADVDRTGGASI